MATILPSIFRQTQQWAEMVESSREDGFTQIDKMIGEGIARATGSLARLQPQLTSSNDLKIAEEIIQTLANQAAQLKSPGHVAEFTAKVELLESAASTEEGVSLSQQLEEARLFSYEVLPSNAEEIRQLIQDKRRLLDLRPVFDFCKEVEQAGSLTMRKIETLTDRLKTFEHLNYPALKKTALLLQEKKRALLERPLLPPPQKLSCAQRVWRLFQSCFSFFFRSRS